MDIIQDFIPVGRNNRPAHPMLPRYITVHETGNIKKGADAAVHSRYVRSLFAANKSVSWHFTCDDHSIYQHLPVIESAFHAGDGGKGIGNRQSIGIEICVNPDGNFELAKANAQWLIRKLMAERSIRIENIVQHNHWDGKNCPQTMRETKTWDAFKNGIIGKDEDIMLERGQNSNDVLAWQEAMISLKYNMGTSGPKKNGADMSFGPTTEAQTKKFQADNGLPQTGKVDNRTYSTMLNKLRTNVITKTVTVTKTVKVDNPEQAKTIQLLTGNIAAAKLALDRK